jgi:PAS domain S-box-containing protein
MHRYGSRVLGRLVRAGLSTRVVAGLVAVIFLTAAATALPAYGLIHSELERQAWSRVEQGATSSIALLKAEQDQLDQLAMLGAQRPTLRSLLRDGNQRDLEAYLTAFAAGASADRFLMWSPDGDLIAGDAIPGLEQDEASATAPGMFIARGAADPVGILSTGRVADTSGRTLATLALIRWLDGDALRQLKAETGLDQSILLDGVRQATTLQAAEDETALNRLAAGALATIDVGAKPFYSVITPAGDPQGRVVLETALSVEGMHRQERAAHQSLLASTVVFAAVASTAAMLLSRSLTRPLDRLRGAARRISRGDLDTPVPIPPGPAEVALLASALEESRVRTRRSLDDLRREKSWSDSLIQSIVEGIVTVDQSGRIASFSSGAERLIGWRAADAIGRPVAAVLRTPNGTSFMEQLPRPGGRRPVQVLDRAGRTMTLSVTDARVRFPASGEGDLALVLRDVSEDEAVRQLRSYFLANISHEFRTPLSAINASVELLLEDLDELTTDDIAGLLRSVNLSVTGLQTLIDNLLESLSIEAGRFTVRRHPSDLGRVIEQAARIMRPLLDRREQPLRVEVPPRLPLIRIDPMRVTQVVVNLLSNASKYSPVRQPIELKVAGPAEGEVRVSVADRGEGIAPADRENLFRRFVRLEPTDPGQYGVGLGLSVVKAIVDEHGGRVGVEPRPGGGSIFWFTLLLKGELR